MRFILLALCAAMLARADHGHAAQLNVSPPAEHGTCAVLDLTTNDMAFAVDSLATLTNASGEWAGSKTACKVRVPRPDVLVVAVGLADTGGGPLRWNALDEASELVGGLPRSLSRETLETWSATWFQTLKSYYAVRGVRITRRGDISEILLVTRIGGKPALLRATISWDGRSFRLDDEFSEGFFFDRSIGKGSVTYFSGLCRSFVPTRAHDNSLVVPKVQLSAVDQARLDRVWKLKREASTVSDLKGVVQGFERELTRIDGEYEKDHHPKIGSPYAVAVWSSHTAGWIPSFNRECDASVPPTKH